MDKISRPHRCGMCRNVIRDNAPYCVVVSNEFLKDKPLNCYGAIRLYGIMVACFCEVCGDNGIPVDLQLWPNQSEEE